ncbi:MAG TPA: cyclopropane-fatty-acyl-phospholipid synthase family protein [Candidatus Baltobacteraceae bacterium]|nr:cyclopropane-fatty-acyl-phospholipid synthase family protein [Candidatus Baltobacteraceae bacterium]
MMTRRAAAVLETVFGNAFAQNFDVRFWDGSTLPSKTTPPAFTFVINSPGALRSALAPPLEANMGAAFVSGALDIEGDLVAAITAFNAANQRRSGVRTARVAYLLLQLPREARPSPAGAQLHGRRHSRRRDRAAISYHYDHPVEFYRTFLDRDLVYSCAYYDDGIDDLDRAQAAKLDYVLRKLRLQPGMSFLDIGCGWGSLVIAAAQRGAWSHGITLSRVQHDEANRRIAELGLADRAKVEYRDYRELRGLAFDRIASIGMFEHVGRPKLAEYFRSAFAALRPGGLFLNHGIAEQSPGRRPPRNPFIERYVFPDGDLVAVSDGLAIAERTGFEVRDVENLREHYARTLRAWVANIERNREEAIARAGEAAYRVWRLYMAASAVSFDAASIGVYQSLLARPDVSGRVTIPPTRRDLYDLSSRPLDSRSG